MLEDLEALLEAKSPYYLGFGHAHLDLFWHPLPPDAPREKEKCHNWHEGKNVQKWPKIMFPEWISLRDVQVAGAVHIAIGNLIQTHALRACN